MGKYASISDEERKVVENRLRRAAARQGLRVAKSRRRDPRALDYGTYSIIDARINGLVSDPNLDLDEVEEYLAP